jgi:hypothetical protein
MKLAALLFSLLVGCATSPAERNDEGTREACVSRIDKAREARLAQLTPVFRAAVGDSEVLAENFGPEAIPAEPSAKRLFEEIGKRPYRDDGRRSWGTAKEGHAFTASGMLLRGEETTDDRGAPIEMLRFSIGQPGRLFEIPVSALGEHGDVLTGRYRGTLWKSWPGTSAPPQKLAADVEVKVRRVDAHHLLLQFRDRASQGSRLTFEPVFTALLRTYVPREDHAEDIVFDARYDTERCPEN